MGLAQSNQRDKRSLGRAHSPEACEGAMAWTTKGPLMQCTNCDTRVSRPDSRESVSFMHIHDETCRPRIPAVVALMAAPPLALRALVDKPCREPLWSEIGKCKLPSGHGGACCFAPQWDSAQAERAVLERERAFFASQPKPASFLGLPLDPKPLRIGARDLSFGVDSATVKTWHGNLEGAPGIKSLTFADLDAEEPLAWLDTDLLCEDA